MATEETDYVATSETTADSLNTAPHDPPVTDVFGAYMATGWAPPSNDLPLRDAVADFTAKRRDMVGARFHGDVLIVPTGNLKVRSNDTDYPFRPGSDFYWLTGCDEPDAVVILDCTHPATSATLFVADRSDRSTSAFYRDRRYGELWVGARHGVKEHESMLGLPCRPLDELQDALGKIPPTMARVLRGFDDNVDLRFPENETAAARNNELAAVLSELRLIKDEYEIERLREAAAATAVGFEECVRELAAAVAMESGERWLEGTFWRRSRTDGNDVGYGSIVACGHHATTLHWMRNDGPVRPGELALLDMGVESRRLYTADITRTLPIDGTFTPLQRQVYEAVYEAQRAGLAAVKPGAAFLDPHRAAMEVLAKKLEDWNVLPCTARESLDGTGQHRRYTLHGVSHMLGIDVHDCANARNELYYDGTLEAGMALTVEPGLYFQLDDETVPAELRGIGVRIEDDVLVTADGYEVLSHHMPTQIDEVEAWMQQVQASGK
jgi:Xaa-Pro aminopeptidase